MADGGATGAAGGTGGRQRVVVVGGGIAGLAAAWELTGGADGPDPKAPAVTVLEVEHRLGGKLRSERFGDRIVDVGPDGFLARRPEATALCRELGLGAELEAIGASGAAIWARGRRRPMPEGLYLGVPTRFLPVARSGILSPLGSARLLMDLVAPRPDRRGPLGDRAIGPLVTRKLGRQAVRRLVEPLLGGIYAGGVGDASAAAVLPPLLQVSQGRASFMRSVGRLARSGPATPGPAAAPEPVAAGPAFWTLRNGLASLVDRLVSALAVRGVELRTECAVTGLIPNGEGWRVVTPTGSFEVDGVVLAVPAQPAAELLAPVDADAAATLQTVAYASVGVVTMAFRSGALTEDLYGTGLLVPRDTPLPPESAAALGAGPDERCMVTACTYLSTKWPHLAEPGQVLVRASVGRFGDERQDALDDEELVERVVGELVGLLGASARPTAAMVTRWREALPQYRVHHLLRVGSVESAARRLGSLAVAGAAYRGVGIPACIASGRTAARVVLAHLRGESSASGVGTETAQPAAT